MRLWLGTALAKERIDQMGGTPHPTSVEEFAGFVQAEIAKWKTVIDREGLQLDIN